MDLAYRESDIHPDQQQESEASGVMYPLRRGVVTQVCTCYKAKQNNI